MSPKAYLSLLSVFCFSLLHAQNQPVIDPDSKESKIKFTIEHHQLKKYSVEVLISGGNFNGSKIEPYYLDKTLVTVEQFEECVKAGVCAPPPDNGNWAATYNRKGNKKRPVNEVNWYTANAYCNWLGKRLPTENEWEWAARGREEGRLYPWGNEKPVKLSACWMRYEGATDTGEGTCEVGENAQSRDGVADMAGNLWEWTSTFANNDKTLVILKGGAWYNDDPEKLKTTYKGHASPYHSNDASDGFRCARSK